MKKYLKIILLCIPIGLILCIGNVKAEIACVKSDNAGTEYAITKSTPIFKLDETNKFFKGSYYYSFTIKDKRAFCIDHGKKMRSNLTYERIGTITTTFDSTQTKNLKKAWAFYEKHSGEDKYRFISQIFIWLAVKNITIDEYEGTIYTALMNYYVEQKNEGYGRTYAAQEAKDLLDEFKKMPQTSQDLYIWKNAENPDSYQRLITALPNGELCVPHYYCPNNQSISLDVCMKEVNNYDSCVQKLCGDEKHYYCPNDPTISLDACMSERNDYNYCTNKFCTSCDIDIDTANKINSCGDGGGTIYETTKGTCLDKYVGWKNNAYGEPVKYNVGNYCQTYCLKSVSETYPGNIEKAVSVGSYLVWPNNKDTTSNQYKINAKLTNYPLQITLTQRCHIMVNQKALKEDYKAASDAEYNAWIKNDGYGNNVGKVFENNSSSCSWYQSNQSDKQKIYNKAKESYDSCIESTKTWSNKAKCNKYDDEAYKEDTKNGKKTNRDDYCIDWERGWVYNEAACSSQKSELNRAQEELNKANNALNLCSDYQTKYDVANNIINEFNNCISSNLTNGLDFSADYSVSFEGEGSYSGDYQLYESSSNVTCDNCSGPAGIPLKSNQYRYSSGAVQIDINNRIAQVENRIVEMTLNKTYDLKEDSANGNYYYYVNKLTNLSTNKAGRGSNYATIGFSNMPIAYNSKTGKKYNISLNLNDIESDSIKSEFKDALLSQQYVCNYEVTKTRTTECVCPSGTKHEGESLDCLINSKNESGEYKYTCSEAQYVYCDSDTNINDYTCPTGDGDLTCPNDPSMDLTACVNEGYSYKYCSDTFCNGKHYVCPKGGTNEGMNLDACVIPMILKGYSEQYAYEYCKDTTCPYGGIKIIYRTISLQNPFPSYYGSANRIEGLQHGMFNDTVKGRYPGRNWNSTKIVKSKILNNRDVDGDAVYNKEPLYTFTLTTDTIKNIRKYNKSQKDSYADYNLNCLISNSTACVSDFVHNASYGLTGGSCGHKLTASNFYTCDN